MIFLYIAKIVRRQAKIWESLAVFPLFRLFCLACKENDVTMGSYDMTATPNRGLIET